MHAIADVAANEGDHVPAAQLMHAEADVALIADDHVPELQTKQVLLTKKNPILQWLEHDAAEVLPALDVNCPELQAMHVDDAVAATTEDQ